MSRGQTPYSILVVDDDPAFRALVSAILKTRGYRVKEAGSADEAAAMFSDRETKLAIVDYRMPGKDGVAWIQKLRDAGKAIPVVFVSGNWCDQKTFTWLRNILQVSLIVKKPIVPAVFLEQVESLLPA
ncbi:MAG TPA: response regulator, partial [Candidatus Obscuribacter sp.]|nr:response regulator [Candidatus Obscuribacter sp.]